MLRIVFDSFVGDSFRLNRSGRAVFDVSPASGRVPAGGEVQVAVSFAPDNVGQFSDVLRVRLFNSVVDYFTGKGTKFVSN